MRIENAKMEIEAEFTEMTFEKRRKGAERIKQYRYLGEGVPSRKGSERRSPEVGLCLAYLRNKSRSMG